MQFSILVNAAPDSGAALSALRTIQAILDHPDHQLYRVFFYRDGVQLANRLAWPGEEENPSPQHQWQSLVQSRSLDAIVCVGAALRRGICNAAEANRHGLEGDSLASGFSLAGLGEWADAVLNSDQVVQFG